MSSLVNRKMSKVGPEADPRSSEICNLPREQTQDQGKIQQSDGKAHPRNKAYLTISSTIKTEFQEV